MFEPYYNILFGHAGYVRSKRGKISRRSDTKKQHSPLSTSLAMKTNQVFIA